MRIVLFVILAVVSLSSCVRERGDENETKNYINVGDLMPEFEIENTVAGGWNGIKSRDDFIGRKNLLLFFTTTCPHCRREMPFVEYAWSELSHKGLTVFPIGRGETLETILAYWNDLNLHLPHYLDTDRAVFDLFANQTVPRFYLVDEDAKVVWMKVGELAPGDFTIEKGDQFIEIIKQKLNL